MSSARNGLDVLMPTTVVGSLPQPDWLVDKEVMLSKKPPRVRLASVWRIPEPYLEEAQDDATYLAVREQERIGLDIVSDGEIRRESYFNRFATALDGIDIDNPAEVEGRNKTRQIVPRVVGEIRRSRPVQVRDVEYLRAITERPIKITMPGPFTMMRLAKDEHYGDRHALLMAYARAVNEEARDLKAAGADIVQLDEPFVESFVDEAEEFAVEGIDRSLEGIEGTTVVHVCFGYGHYVQVEKPNRYSFPGPPQPVPGDADLHRGGAAAARSLDAGAPARQAGDVRRARPQGPHGRDPGNRRGTPARRA